MVDYLIWYGKNFELTKYRPLFTGKDVQGASRWNLVEQPDGSVRTMSNEEWNDHKLLPLGCRVHTHASLKPSGVFEGGYYNAEVYGKIYPPPQGGCWATTKEGMSRLVKANRIGIENTNLRYRIYLEDYPVMQIHNFWTDTSGASDKVYIVQTMTKVIQRCLLMTTDPGDLVLDPTCGSGTTAYVAEQWGRRWITVDTSRVAIALARTRLMAGRFPYYLLSDSPEGIRKEAELNGQIPPSPLPATVGEVKKGFIYSHVPHITLKSIATNDEIDTISVRWQEPIDSLRAQINQLTGKTWQEWEMPRLPSTYQSEKESTETEKALRNVSMI